MSAKFGIINLVKAHICYNSIQKASEQKMFCQAATGSERKREREV